MVIKVSVYFMSRKKTVKWFSESILWAGIQQARPLFTLTSETGGPLKVYFYYYKGFLT
jgi:hypothetical protein